MTDGGPILVIGVSHRCGTNFLWRLLRCHAACVTPATIYEDHLFVRADLLERYVAETASRWDPSWGDVGPAVRGLREALAGGLAGFVDGLGPSGRSLLKTPDPANLHLVPRFLPAAELLVLVRDGRSVAESYARGFGTGYEAAFRTWRDGAREVLRYLAGDAGRRARLVRYEDLVTETESEIGRILDLVGLPADGFDWEAARNLPVYGSSTHRGGSGQVHWQPVERTGDFRPLERHAGWPRERVERFSWVAGDEMRMLGYGFDADAGPVLRQRFLDARHALGRQLRQAIPQPWKS